MFALSVEAKADKKGLWFWSTRNLTDLSEVCYVSNWSDGLLALDILSLSVGYS